ncbi:MAG: hypothetical protein Kow0092_31730 [Deferrisomatales bacterium]
MSDIILHVEDDPALATLVQALFARMGFSGEVIHVPDVPAALDRLGELEAQGRRPRLILLDLRLQHGSGLDLIRQVRAAPQWRALPILVLSSEEDQRTVNEAYALGASCFFPKQPPGGDVLGAVEALYRCWLEGARLPTAEPEDRAAALLRRAIAFETRAAELYAGLARQFAGDPELFRFWIQLSLEESNHANLLAFLGESAGEGPWAEAELEPVARTLEQVGTCLDRVSAQTAGAERPSLETALTWALQVEACPSEELLLEGLSLLSEAHLETAAVFRESMKTHVEGLVRMARRQAGPPALLALADRVEAQARRLAAAPPPR